MKKIERIKITEADLRPSKTLVDAGYLVYPWKNETGEEIECPLYGWVSEPCDTEKEALASLNNKLLPIFEAMPGSKIYSMYGEIKVWCLADPNNKNPWVAYETIVIPGLTSDQIRDLINVSKKE